MQTKLGLVCFSSKTGLGIQTYNLYKYLKPAKIMLVDLSVYNKQTQHNNWYKDAKEVVQTNGIPKNDDIDEFLNGLDAVLVCETPLNYYLFSRAKELNIKTLLQYNYEFLDYLQRPSLPAPDYLLAPSKWNIKTVKKLAKEINSTVIDMPVPVDDEVIKIKKAPSSYINFVHIAGRPAVYDRNGTIDLLEAWYLAKDKNQLAKLTIYIQDKDIGEKLKSGLLDDSVNIINKNIDNYADMYLNHDVLVMPRKYGGLCLPVNEALGYGMPVIMTDIDPNNTWLPDKWLVPATLEKQFMTRTMIDIYKVDTKELANMIAEFSNYDEMQTNFNYLIAKNYSKDLGWSNNWVNEYRQIIEC